MKLTATEQAMLQGVEGPAVQLAMEIVCEMGELQGADELIAITGAHIDGTVYEGDAIVDFVERLAELGAKVRVPSTLNAVSVDVKNWRKRGIPEHYATQAMRIVDGYLAMGLRPTFTCSPYQIGYLPKFGEQVAWGESNAIAFANSVCGARTERYGDFMDISAAIVGRVPAVGLHLTENRRAKAWFRIADDIDDELRHSDIFYPLLGYWIGEHTGADIPVVSGIPQDVTSDRLKALLAASASSGAVALMHMVGVTPEAPDLDTACQGQAPEAVFDVTRDDLRKAFASLNHSATGELDAVVLGSPHFSAQEFTELAHLVRGREKHPDVKFLVTTNRASYESAKASGVLEVVEGFGAEIVQDTCILLAPILDDSIHTMMTNSGKYAHYSPGRLGVKVYFGTLEDTVESAVAGSARWRGF
ncbi:aconitase X catalytic domain-containing protein [Alicyclobacillus sp. ALC3]|uniref:aconitase X catalytic domain-containing protein n=1 Tax=Alicyclobacillus sp. ALC3 TaxID=2796143 RepID=UPI002379A49C|nr:aconitase X catalytic domain-containing protein [Alicyclobacillus sp. ALC3]WDL97642.1 aconitase X catalytic domain-containing protein [Alicyclobacillus sp. ALC3]